MLTQLHDCDINFVQLPGKGKRCELHQVGLVGIQQVVGFVVRDSGNETTILLDEPQRGPNQCAEHKIAWHRTLQLQGEFYVLSSYD